MKIEIQLRQIRHYEEQKEKQKNMVRSFEINKKGNAAKWQKIIINAKKGNISIWQEIKINKDDDGNITKQRLLVHRITSTLDQHCHS